MRCPCMDKNMKQLAQVVVCDMAMRRVHAILAEAEDTGLVLSAL